MSRLNSTTVAAALQYTPAEEAAWTELLTTYMRAEAERFAKSNLQRFDLIIVRMYDSGTFLAAPGSYVLPHGYPESRKALERMGPHFTYPVDWKAVTCPVGKFDELYHQLPDSEKSEELFVEEFDAFTALRVAALKKACAGLGPSVQVLAFVHDAPLCIPMAIHVSGPPTPVPTPPKSDVALFSRLRQCGYNYVSETAFEWKGDHIAKVSISGSDLDDRDLEFVWAIPDLKSLSPALEEVVIEHSSVTEPVIERLRKRLPGVVIRYSKKSYGPKP